MPVIYLDVLLALNLFIDFLLLSATSRILRLPQKRWRMVLGALLGSASSCLIFLPDMHPIFSIIIKIAAAAIIIRIAFVWKNAIIYIKQLAVFLVTSALFAGIAFAIWFFAAPSGFYVMKGVVYYDVSPLVLIILTVVSYVAISIYDRLTHKKVSANRDYHLLIDCGNGTANIHALYDTGHHVTDVFSGSPVAIVSYRSIGPYMSEDLRKVVCEALSNTGIMTEHGTTETAVQTRLRMIPFRSVNGTGLLPAYKPKHMSIASLSKSTDITGTYIAVCSILGRGEYDAIIGTDIANLLEGSHAS